MDNIPQWKFIETLNCGSYNIEVYSDEQQGLILYEYFTKESDFCEYSYVAYTNEKAKQLLADVGVETYDSGQGTFGIKLPGEGCTIMFGAGKKEIDRLVDKYSNISKQEAQYQKILSEKNDPMQSKHYITLVGFIIMVTGILWLFSG